jgi:hypothetical protein
VKIAVFLDHDIIIRHFVHSGAFAELARRHELVFVFPEDGGKRVKMDVAKLDLNGAAQARVSLHGRRHWLWSTLLFADYFRPRRGPIHAALRDKLRRQFGPKLTVLYTALGLPGAFQLFRAWVRVKLAATPNFALEAFLNAQRPDAIIHPSILEGIYINDLVEASQRRAIPLVVIMNSWDNPSSKRAVVGRPDWLLVWGEQTWRHACEFVGMAPDRAVRFGAAQLDVFRTCPRIDRAEFCRRNGVDPATRVVLYAGSSKQTDEFEHVRELDAAIERGELGATTIVYRPHPWGEGGKDGGRFLDHPWKHVRLETTMRGYLEAIRRGDLAMSFPDYRDTHDVLASVDAVISPLSTIIVEAAMHAKPVMCFLPYEEVDAKHFQLAAHMPHFTDLFENPDVVIARSRVDLIAKVKCLVEQIGDDALRQRLIELSCFFVTPHDAPYPERLLNFFEQRVASAATRPASVPGSAT